MKITAKTLPTTVEVDISIEDMIAKLKEYCGVLNPDGSFKYEIEDNKIIKYEDVSCIGEPQYLSQVVTSDPAVVEMYSAILSYEKAYNSYNKKG